jgi:deoxycytidine triphosphate deaminase
MTLGFSSCKRMGRLNTLHYLDPGYGNRFCYYSHTHPLVRYQSGQLIEFHAREVQLVLKPSFRRIYPEMQNSEREQ